MRLPLLDCSLPTGNYWELLEAQQYNLTLELPAPLFQYNSSTWEGTQELFKVGGKWPGLHLVRAWKAPPAGVVSVSLGGQTRAALVPGWLNNPFPTHPTHCAALHSELGGPVQGFALRAAASLLHAAQRSGPHNHLC